MVVLTTIVGSVLALGVTSSKNSCEQRTNWVLVTHGGAGAWNHPADVKRRMIANMKEVLRDGGGMLAAGHHAVDVVESVIARLEDAPEFNAGRGGIPNREGFVELDAAIMRGSDLNSGAVAGLRTVKNPIRLARAVMEQSPHVMFVDRGAENFARQIGVELVEPSYFLVKKVIPTPPSKSGTVGAVVADRCGEIAAGTSTGGYNAKQPGRVGDVPIIGAGTYANHQTAAISATGWGEWFIRFSAAHDVSALMAYKKLSVRDALREVLKKIYKPKGATGGLIAVTPSGEWSMYHTSPGMLRGVISDNSKQPTVWLMEKEP